MNKYCLGILFSFLTILVHAQIAPLNVSIIVLPPYSMEAMDYFSSPTQTTLTILNPTNQSFSVYLAGSLTNLSTNQQVTIPNNVTPAAPPLIVEPGIRIMTGADLKQYIDESSVQFSGISQEQIISGNLPEGEYQLCLQAYDYQTNELRSQNQPLGCSNVFTIQFVQPPILISPQCSTEVTNTTPQNFVFSWFPPVVSINPGLLSYEFKLVELPEGMNPLQVMNSTGVPILVHISPSPVFLYSTLSPALIPGRFYAWRVKVTDVSQTIAFSNNGESEICTFRYGMPFLFDNPPTSTLVYPVPGKRIPFIQVPLISRTEPFDSTVTSLSVETEVREGNEIFDQIQLSKEYPNGLRALLQQQLGVFPTLQQLQHAEIGRDLSNVASFGDLKPGKTYTVKSNHSFTHSDGHTETAHAEESFLQGFEKPVLQVPARDTTYQIHTVSFKFKTSDFPIYLPNEMGLIPPSDLLNSLIGNDPKLFKAEVNERYRIEVASSNTFTNILFAASGVFNESIQILKTTSIEAVKDRFYKTVKKDIFLPDTGEYFWRVHWLSDRNDSASAPYQTSETNRFRIAGTLADDAIQSACMSDCDAPEILDRTPVTGLLVNQKVKVGKFDMEIKSIEYLGPSARGTGLINVPFMHANIKVEFNEALINAAKQLYQGNVFASHDNSNFLPNIPGVGQLTVTKPEELLNYVLEGRCQSILDPSVPMGLPLGLDKEIEGERYVVAIVGMNFGPERASLSAAMSFALPFLPERTSDGETQRIGLGASDICFHPQGLAGVGVATLYLADPLEADYAPGQYFRLNSTQVTAGIVADSGTYVSGDCEGFRVLHLSGQLTFDNSVLEAATTNGSKSLKPVRASFGFNVRRSGNWLAALDFTPFMIPGIDDWTFQVDDATLDFSDLENPPTMVFPEDYVGERSVLWNGFHLKNLRVGLPKKFKIRLPDTDVALADSVLKDRVVVSINDLIIDRTGITGKLEALRILELENGMLGDWSFSVDTLSLKFVSNSFVRGGFNGRIKTPLSPTLLSYESVLSQGSIATGIVYQFNARALDTLIVPIWAAKLNLLPTSRIIVHANSTGFTPELNLNGNVSITTTIGEIPIDFKGIVFESLKLTSASPYLTCQNFTFASPQKFMAGFPVTISDVNLGTQETHGLFSWDDTPGPRIALNFRMNVNLTGETNTFSGTTSFAILGRFDPGGTIAGLANGQFVMPTFALSGIDLKSIQIAGDLGFVKANGFISFYQEDPIYGKGFNGGIDATFIKSINVAVVGGFGEKNNKRYWYLDAMAKFVPGIPMGVAPYQIPMDIYGFGGGAFYNMTLANLPPPAADINTKNPEAIPPPGTTLSGIQLTPSRSSTPTFGLIATAVIGTTGGGNAFNADLTLTAVINSSGGLTNMGFKGTGYFMTSVMDRTFTSVSAEVLLQYDFPNTILTGNFGVMANVPNVLRGTHPGNMTGNGYLYVGKDKWQLLVGKPDPQDARLGLELGGVFNATAYLMAGQQLPPSPPPPSKVTDILGGRIPNQRTSAISIGRGFAFGASFIPPKIKQDYSPFYCELDAEIGFDMSYTDHGSERCDGMSPLEQMGTHGWYSSGNAWGYLKGSIGVVNSLFEDNVRYDILDVKAAILMQSSFSNPQWFKGTLGGNYSILNGLVEGTCRFQLQQGNFCYPPPESPAAGINLISQVLPAHNQNDVDCAVDISAVFNVDIGRIITFKETGARGEKRTRTFRFRIEEFSLKKGNVLITNSRVNDFDGSQSKLPLGGRMLEPFTTYKIKVTVSAEEYLQKPRFTYFEWFTATKNDGNPISETMNITFTTGPLPNRIRESDITYSLPLHNQRYYVNNNEANGQISLKYDLSYLFDIRAREREGYNRTFHAQFQPVAGGALIETNARYENRKVIFEQPQLSPSTIYQVRIILRDVPAPNQGQSTQSNSIFLQNQEFKGLTSSRISFSGGSVLVRDRKFDGPSPLKRNEFDLYAYYFRTSMHQTYTQKLSAISASKVSLYFNGQTENLVVDIQGSEGFEDYELNGFVYNDPTTYNQTSFKVLKASDTYATNWHSEFVSGKIYNTYTNMNCPSWQTCDNRRLSRIGTAFSDIPPAYVTGNYLMKGPLRRSEIFPNESSSSSLPLAVYNQDYNVSVAGQQAAPIQTLIMETSYYAKLDYDELQQMCAVLRTIYGNNLRGRHRTLNYWLDPAIRDQIVSLLNTPYAYMPYGNYGIRFSPQYGTLRATSIGVPYRQVLQVYTR